MFPPDLTPLLEEIEAWAMADAYGALGARAPEMGVQAENIGGAQCCMIAKFGSTFFNRVVGLGVGRPASEHTLDRVIGLFDDAKQPVAIQLSPEARPPEVAAWLADRGFQPKGNWAKFYRDTSSPPEISTGTRVEVVTPAESPVYAG